MQTRVDTELSDLFFNHTHDQYDNLNFKEATREDMEQAILADAMEFVESYPTASQGYMGQELANDFMERL